MHAVAELVDVDEFRFLGGADRDAAFMGVEREIRRLQACQLEMVQVVASSGSFMDDAHQNVRSWLAAVTNTGRDTAFLQVRVARMLAGMPAVATAAAQGRIGGDQLKMLSRLWANVRCRDLMPESDEMLAGFATGLDVRDFETAVRRWKAYADPDGDRDDRDACHENRKASIRPVGQGYELRASGDGLLGEALAKIIDAQVQVEFQADIDARSREHGADAANHPLARTAAQRRHDALQHIIEGFANMKASCTPAAAREPVVNLFCSEAELAAAIREHLHTGPEPEWTPTTPTSRSRLCETAGGVALDRRTLLHAALIGSVRRVVVDSAGRVIDLGRRQRLFRGAAREAVLLSGDRCLWPGCDIRGPSIQIDHLTGYTLGGTTCSTNGGPECPIHNRAKHRLGITVKRDETGWHLHRADGTEIASRTA